MKKNADRLSQLRERIGELRQVRTTIAQHRLQFEVLREKASEIVSDIFNDKPYFEEHKAEIADMFFEFQE